MFCFAFWSRVTYVDLHFRHCIPVVRLFIFGVCHYVYVLQDLFIKKLKKRTAFEIKYFVIEIYYDF